MLSREEILKCLDLPRQEVPVPEWGGSVTVRALTGTERDLYELWLADQRKQNCLANVRAKFASLCVVTSEGRPLFTPLDVEALGQLDSAPLDRIFEAGRRLSRMNEDTEDVAKNSAGAGGSSTSASPPGSAAPSANCLAASAATS